MDNNEIKRNKRIPVAIIIGVIVCLIILAGLVIFIISRSFESKTTKIQKQLDLGERYLTELDYENAILAYENVISMDPATDVYSTLIGAYDTWIDVLIQDKKFDEALDFFDRKIASLERGISSGFDFNALLQTTKEERDTLELQSSATTVRINTVTVQEKEGRRTVSEYTYDADGRLIREPHSNLLAPIINCYIDIEYDEQGRKARETFNYFDVVWENGMECEAFESFSRIHKYAGSEENIYWGDTNTLYQEIEYDEQGNLLRVHSYDKNGQLISDYEYTYDDKGRELSEINHLQGSKEFFFYDLTETELKERITNNTESGVDGYHLIVRNGLIEKRYSFDANGKDTGMLIIETKDYLGNLVLSEYYYNGTLSFSTEYEYVYLK